MITVALNSITTCLPGTINLPVTDAVNTQDSHLLRFEMRCLLRTYLGHPDYQRVGHPGRFDNEFKRSGSSEIPVCWQNACLFTLFLASLRKTMRFQMFGKFQRERNEWISSNHLPNFLAAVGFLGGHRPQDRFAQRRDA
jgi:hypothetical protein